MLLRRTQLILCVCLVAFCTAEIDAGQVDAITRPSKDVTLSFVVPGRIAKVLVKAGQSVKAGQILVGQDDTADQIQLAHLEAQANNTTRIDAAQAQTDQKLLDLARLQKAMKRKAATELELEHAKLGVRIAELSLALARFEQIQARRKYKEAKALADQKVIKSPISGTVEQVHVQVGESAPALAKVVRIVKTNPLWLDAAVPLDRANKLKVNHNAVVTYTGKAASQQAAHVPGKIVFISSVADGASTTRNVRVEIPNTGPKPHPAGEHVRVAFSPAAPDEDTVAAGKADKQSGKNRSGD
ncbi:MAG: efflux RND transporter periplasmic adaptor subunit [Phycisphaerae bacterium]|jgi:RND family efflux transporter MFP subunit|nr:efflux RND transporter periplasmic adaptor subunit [Phycisphaerae bacterium]